jgi:hypothetical protein
MSLTKRLGMLIVTVVLSCAYVATAGAQSRAVPFKVKGGGAFSSGLPVAPSVTANFQANGTANQLGKYTTEGTFTLGSLQISPTGVVSGTFQEVLVFVAANADRLTFSSGASNGIFTGQLSADGTTITGVTFGALLSPDPAHSTGRFSKVTGGSIMLVTSADAISLVSTVPGFTSPFSFTWEGEGLLLFG